VSTFLFWAFGGFSRGRGRGEEGKGTGRQAKDRRGKGSTERRLADVFEF